MTEVDGVVAVFSIRHPKLVAQDLDRLVAGVPETALVRMGLASLAPYGYPEFTEIEPGSNVGIAVLRGPPAGPATFVGFAKLKEGGKLWNLLGRRFPARRRHGDWVLFARTPADLAKLKAPDSAIAFLEKPQTADICVWARAYPEYLARIEAGCRNKLNSLLAKAPPDRRQAGSRAIDILIRGMSEIRSGEVSLSFADSGIKIEYAVQFRPDSPAGTFLRYPLGPDPEIASHISGNALVSFVFRQNPVAAADLANTFLNALARVGYPPLTAWLKTARPGLAAAMAESNGGAAAVFDFAYGTKNAGRAATPALFYAASGHFTPEVVRMYMKSVRSLSPDIFAAVQASMPSRLRALSWSKPVYTENAVTVDGVAFDLDAMPGLGAPGGAVSPPREYIGVAGGNLVIADSESILRRNLPNLTARAPLADGLRLVGPPDTLGDVELHGANLVGDIEAALGSRSEDEDAKARFADLRSAYAAAGPVSVIVTASQARVTETVFIPYKFIETSIRLGQYMSARRIDFRKLFGLPGPSARHPWPRRTGRS
ncbi:MAG: hypothetical protein ACREFX_15315 [Opitutaceae bacterium]